MARTITVVPYDPCWPQRFQREADRLAAIFGAQVVAIHHIGSTAIPHIHAKPIIDLLVAVQDVNRIDAFDAEMTRRGYLPRGTFGIPGRRFFIKGSEKARTHHIHVFGHGHPAIARHLNFRDYLIAHPQQAQAYSRLKQRLARQFPHDIEGYMAGKDAFIQSINRQARAWRAGPMRKVYAYITQDDQLLVFRHTHYPEAGIQVPGGTLEPGEDPRQAILREAHEETGLENLDIRAYLGACQFDLATVGGSGFQMQHFFHLTLDGPTPARWRHFEQHPSDGSPAPIEFTFFWVRFPDQVPVLSGGQGALVGYLNLTR